MVPCLMVYLDYLLMFISGLKSGKINGKGKPEVKKVSPSVVKVLKEQ